ncbi:MAG: PulJ/GspJ family protein [Kiritimatiellia bacterium]
MPTPISATCSKAGPPEGFTLLEVLISLLILAVLSAGLARILQSSLLTNQQIKLQLQSTPEQQHQLHLQLAGEREEALVELIPQ